MTGSQRKQTVETTSTGATPQMASNLDRNSPVSVKVIGNIHLRRNRAMVAWWRLDMCRDLSRSDRDTSGGFMSSMKDRQPARCASRRLRAVATVALGCGLLALSACESSTSYGRCIGLNQDPDSALRYEYSARNIVWGIVGVELIAPPVIVGLNELRCPVARRPSAGGRQP